MRSGRARLFGFGPKSLQFFRRATHVFVLAKKMMKLAKTVGSVGMDCEEAWIEKQLGFTVIYI